MPCQSNNNKTNTEMKTELNTALVSILANAMTSGLAAIHREERKLVNVIADAWTTFIASKDGAADHWSYFAEDGSVKRYGVLEFRAAALAAGEEGGYSRTYVSDLLRDVSEDFVIRASASRPRASKVKFSEAQLESVGKAALQISLSKGDIKKLLAALVA